MPNIIQHKRNSTPGSIPGTGSLAQGELGLNLADGRLYTKNSSNVIINLPVTSISGTVISPASGLFSGRIGVGTTSPSGTLQVVGTGLVSSVTGTAPNSLFHVYSATSGANIFNVEGTNGSLFSVVDSLSGSLMSVNNNAGLPVFEVFSDDRVVAGRYNLNDFVITSGGNIGVGISSPSSKMQVSGLLTANSGNFVNSLTLNGSGVAIISGTKLNQLANTSSSELLGVITDETGSGLLVFNNSPTLTGVPLAPTASSGTNTNQIASTAFVRTEISNLVASAPSTLDTLNELSTALGNDANFSTTVTNNLAGKANLSGATFTGTVSAPTGNFTILQQNGTGVSVSGHSHGNITSSGTIGSTSDQILVTAGGGLISTLSYAPKANMLYDITNDWDMFSIIDTTPVWTQNAIDSDVPTQFRDSISAASSTHSHGNITNSGAIGSASGLLVITTTSGLLTTTSGVSSSYITNFNTAVSGLLPTIANSADNRILTSTGSSVGVNAEEGLTFDGSLFNVIGTGNFKDLNVLGEFIPESSYAEQIPGTIQTNKLIIKTYTAVGPTDGTAGSIDLYSVNSSHKITLKPEDFPTNANGVFVFPDTSGGTVSIDGHTHTTENISVSGEPLSVLDNFILGRAFGGSLTDAVTYDGGIDVYAINDFNSSVSGLLPVTNIVAGTNITVSNNAGAFTINTTGVSVSGHSHGNISSSGTIGTTSGRPLITTADGVVTTGVFGNASGTFCQGNDSRLSDSRDPNSHTHYSNQIYELSSGYGFDYLDPIVFELGEGGSWASVRNNILEAAAAVHSHGNITSSGTIGSTSGLLITTTSNGQLTTSSSISSSLISNFNSSVSGLFSKTYSVFSATDNQPPASAFATLDTRNSIAVLDFDDTTKETAVFVGVMPQSVALASGLSIRTHWMATTATSGDCRWEVSLERCNTDLDSDSFDTVSTGSSTTNGTAGIPTVTSITLTTIDSVAAGDLYRLRVSRDAANGADTMVGDAELIAVEVRSAG